MFLSKQKSQVCYSEFRLIGILTGKHWDLARKLEKNSVKNLNNTLVKKVAKMENYMTRENKAISRGKCQFGRVFSRFLVI